MDLYLHATHNREECVAFWGLPFSYIRQYDKRRQVKTNKTKENYGTVRVNVRKPLGLRPALHEFSFAYNGR